MAQISGQIFHVFYSWDQGDPAADLASGQFVPGPIKECVVIASDESGVGTVITADDSSAPAGATLNIRAITTDIPSTVPIYQ